MNHGGPRAFPHTHDATQGEGNQEIQTFCGCHKWMLPFLSTWSQVHPLFAAANPLLTFRGPFSVPLSFEPVSPSEHGLERRGALFVVKKAHTILPIFQTAARDDRLSIIHDLRPQRAGALLFTWVTHNLVDIDEAPTQTAGMRYKKLFSKWSKRIFRRFVQSIVKERS